MELFNESLTDQRPGLCHIIRNTRGQEWFDIFQKRSIPELAIHVFFEFRARDGKAIVFQVALETINDLGGVESPKQ